MKYANVGILRRAVVFVAQIIVFYVASNVGGNGCF
jgi:hypothetical protein